MGVFERFVQLVPPPERPRGGVPQWAHVEAKVGTKLPDDYKRLLDLYGAGELCGEFRWPAPNDYPLYAAECLDPMRKLRGEGLGPEAALFPEASGILPWADPSDGSYFLWTSVGEPNYWPTGYGDIYHGVEFGPGSATDRLLEYVTGTGEVVHWSPSVWYDGQSARPWFRPAPSLCEVAIFQHFDQGQYPFRQWIEAVVGLFESFEPRHYDTDGSATRGQASMLGDGLEVNTQAWGEHCWISIVVDGDELDRVDQYIRMLDRTTGLTASGRTQHRGHCVP